MRFYTVHRRSRGVLAEPDVEFVKEGFSWPAAIFGFLWALWHRMWWTAVGLFVAEAAISLLLDHFEADTSVEIIVGIAVAALIGWAADDLRRAALAVRGFAVVGVVAAPGLDAAEQRFFEETGLTA